MPPVVCRRRQSEVQFVSVPNGFPSAAYQPGSLIFLLTRSNRDQVGRAVVWFVKQDRYVSAFVMLLHPWNNDKVIKVD